MTFKEFANRLGDVIRAESSTHAFAKTLFESVIPIDKVDVLKEYKDSTFKAYYNGNAQITRLAKKINMDADAECFAEFIDGYEDAVVQKICDAFIDVIPDIDCFNAGIKLGGLFVSIISEAAANKKSASKGAKNVNGQLAIITDAADVAPDLAEYKDGVLYLGGTPHSERGAFTKFVDKSVDYYSAKKTLLYAEKPLPFYDLYVCNNLRYHKQRITGVKDPKPEITISDASVTRLEEESKYIIIQGTGGIGKSMFLTHLFLSSTNEYESTGRLPILVSLKDYKEDTARIVDLAWNAVKEYDSEIPQKHIIEMLEEKKSYYSLTGWMRFNRH